MMVRWPANIKGGRVSNETISHLDWVPTLMAAVGEPDVKKKLKAGHEAAGKKFKVHLDGYNFLPNLTGEEKKGPRKEFLYWNDGGQLVGLRYNHWKLVFMEQREKTFNVWTEPSNPAPVQPPIGSVRTCQHGFEQLQYVVDPSCLRYGACPDVRVGIHIDFQGISATPEASQVQR